MDNLVFSLNATIPIFLLMVLGFFFRKIHWIDDLFAERMNTFVFRVVLPVLVFEDLATVDFGQLWNLKFVLFCLLATLLSIALMIALSFLWKDQNLRGEFIQGSYRSSAALLGIAFIQNIYGDSGLAPLMIIGSVPLYNVMAVTILCIFDPENPGMDKETIKTTLKGIVKNPIIIGILAGILWSVLGLPMPQILGKTVSNVGTLATPLGLMAMGATFDFRKALAKKKPAFIATFFKLIGLAAIFLPIAIFLGFREQELVAILVMLGSATTVSSFVMARNMGYEGTLSSSIVMLTTLLSAFSLTGWLYLLRYLQLI